MAAELNEREQTVLRYVVQDFIETATPVGSRYISRRHEDVLGLSSASIRNVLSDLEYRGYINHPHTSAGRVPTDLGYRFYLDRLMELSSVSDTQQQAIRQNLDTGEDPSEILHETSRLLARISHQLCIVAAPELSAGVFERIELVPITSNRMMVIISIKSGLVRTIMMEAASEIRREKLDELGRLLNERLSGLTLQQIRETFEERVRDVQQEESGLVSLFIESVDKLFVPPSSGRLHIAGADGILDQPEFMNPKEFRSVIEMISNEEMIVHVLRKHENIQKDVAVTVGKENADEKLEPYSIVTAKYTLGEVGGTVGLMGPKRMPYDRMIPLVDFVARAISDMFARQQH